MKASIDKLDPISTAKLRNAIQDLYQRFMRLSDWRTREPEYPISYLHSVITLGLVMGDNNVAAIENTLVTKDEAISFLLGKKNYFGCPSDTTLLNGLRHTSPTELNVAVTEWSMKWFGAGLNYSIDGKACKGGRKQVEGRTHAPYILNGFASSPGGRYIAAQLKIEDKKSELSVVNSLLEAMPMAGAFITADAFATYPFVVKDILARGGNCLLPLKENQPKMCEKATSFILNAIADTPDLVSWHEDEDNGEKHHGRTECRTTAIITEGVPELVKGTSFEGLIEGIAIISRDRSILRKGDTPDINSNQTLVYMYTKQDMTAAEVAYAARGHWAGCEIIHYVLDMEFDEDLSTIRTDHGMENMSCLRKCAYSILLWIQAMIDIGSFHAIRMMLRDLNGIPNLKNSEYRKKVREEVRRARKKRARPDFYGTCPMRD